MLTEQEFRDPPFLLFKFEASPKRDFLSNFSILFTWTVSGRLSLLARSYSLISLQFLFDATSAYTYVRTCFSGLRRCACVCIWGRLFPARFLFSAFLRRPAHSSRAISFVIVVFRLAVIFRFPPRADQARSGSAARPLLCSRLLCEAGAACCRGLRVR